MTKEEAIKIINCYDIGFYDLSGEKIPADKLADAFDMAIEALSADTSSDLISRSNAIRWVKTECNQYGKPTLDYDSGLKVIEHLKKMPSELPSAGAKTKCIAQIKIDRDDLKDLVNGKVNEIVDNMSETKTGEWIDKGEYAECSLCGAHSGTQFDGVEPIPLKTNFCPNCGARMEK